MGTIVHRFFVLCLGGYMCNGMRQTGGQEQVGFKDVLMQFIESPNSIHQQTSTATNGKINGK